MEPVVSFDPKKAHIHRLNSRLRYADVVVQIPRQVKAIDELKPTTAPDERYELFEDYTIGIWRYKRVDDKEFVWEEAEKCVSKQGMKKADPNTAPSITGTIICSGKRCAISIDK